MLRNFIKDEDGQDLVEYSILLSLIAVVVIITLAAIGNNLKDILGKISTKVDNLGKTH
jgi:Flp pilus assembly pilin Flp